MFKLVDNEMFLLLNMSCGFRHLLKQHNMTLASYVSTFKTSLHHPTLNAQKKSTPALPDPPPMTVQPNVDPGESLQVRTGNSEFDEDKFKETLKNMNRTKASIDKIVSWCIDQRLKAYKTVRCWVRMMKTVEAAQALTLFYFFHNLALESSKQNHLDFSKMLGKSILDLLPKIKDIVPLSKIEKCLSIWTLSSVFDKDVLVRLDKITCLKVIEYINLEESELPVAGSPTVLTLTADSSPSSVLPVAGVPTVAATPTLLPIAAAPTLLPNKKCATERQFPTCLAGSIPSCNQADIPMSLAMRLRIEFDINMDEDEEG